MINLNLTNTIKSLNLKDKQKILFVIIIVALACLIYFFTRINTQKSNTGIAVPQIVNTIPETNKFEINAKENKNWGIDAKTFDTNALPTQVVVYEYAPVYFTDQLIEKITNTLGVKYTNTFDDPVLGKTIKASQGNKSLAIYQDSGKFSYNDTSPIREFLSKDEDFYKQKATNLITNLNINKDEMTFDRFEYYLTTPTGELEKAPNKITANIVAVFFMHKKDGYPIIQNKSLTPTGMTIWMDNIGEIKKVTGQIPGKTQGQLGVVSMPNASDIIEQVRNGKPKLAQTYLTGNYPINSVTANSIEIVYYVDQNKIIPLFRIFSKLNSSYEVSIGTMFMDIQ